MDTFPKQIKGADSVFLDTKTANLILNFLNALRTMTGSGGVKVTVSANKIVIDGGGAIDLGDYQPLSIIGTINGVPTNMVVPAKVLGPVV